MSQTPVSPPTVQSLGQQLAILAEPNRLRIIDLLMQGVQCNCTMGDQLQMPPNLISHHLSVLRRAGLIHSKRHPQDARWILYWINRPAIEALRGALSDFLDPARWHPGLPACRSQPNGGASSGTPRVEPIRSAPPKRKLE